ncbi:response regulator [Butyrivibrio sp. LB2008]|uniref:response regulator n=1 Tax=Butyrivibrio sp. LB2008 TaxID=1408305 RepID=UPI00068572BE|nr:response regulator [Butyrivibrio sp. LB2008]
MDSLLNILKLRSIKHQLKAIFAMLVVLPIVIIGVYAYVVSKSNVTELTRASMKGSAEVIANGIEMGVKRETDVIKFFSYEEAFRRALDHADADPYTLSAEMTETIEPLIWYYIGSDSDIEEIHIYSERIKEDRIGEFLSYPHDEGIKAWYEMCRGDNGSIWVINEKGDVYIIKSLLDAATTSKMIGMITLKVNKKSFFSTTTNTRYQDNGIAIVDSSNKIVAKKDLRSSVLDRKVTEDIMAGKYVNLDGFKSTDDYLIIKSKEMNNGWQMYYYVDSREMLADEITILLGDLIIAITILALGFLIASQMANQLCTRIEGLNIIAEDIKRGDFEVAIVDDGKDEIGQLYKSMIDMASQLNTMVDEIKRRNERELFLKENDIHYRDWLFDFVVEKNNDILAIVNAKSFEVEFLTANAADILGIPSKELFKDIRNINIAQKTGKEDRLSTIFERCAQTGKVEVVDEIRLHNYVSNTDLYYRGAVACTIDDSGRRLAIALYDRTQEIMKNHQLQEAFNAAETANRAKTNFLANMSHDFRTPMNAITGFNLLIEKHYDEPEKVREYTRKIGLASRNLLALLNEVLDMSKIESGRTTLDIKEMAIGILLEEINSVIAYQAKVKRQEYIVNAEGLRHDVFMGDKQRINEILMNILSNAIKYTGEGGKIEFTIKENESATEGFNDLIFVIKDNGIGMKPEYKERIFEAFSREESHVNKEIQGTGLGMAITRSLVELMGGTIRVESEEGKGSTFTVILRLQAVDEADVDFWKSHGIRRILFIDSKHSECEQLAEKLNNDGVDVMESPTGFGALHLIDVCQAEDTPVDLILVDQKVQNMTAPEIVKNIRAKDKAKSATSLIIVMADDFESIEDEAKEAGANDLLQKPLFISSLKQSINDIAKRITEANDDETENPLNGMKFLAVEDNDINADILAELMAMEGASVIRCVNGQEAVEKFKASKEGDFDMILMDIQMPVMNGYEATILIRGLKTEWAQKIPIIAMTANAYADDIQKSYDSGMNAHISKPIDIKVVEKTIMEFKKA